MKALAYSIVSFLLMACAMKKWEPVKLEPYTVTTVNPYNKEIVVDSSYKNGIEVYKRMLSSGRINSKKSLSCFQNESFFKDLRFQAKESVNYIELIPSNIAYFRSLHVDNQKMITYTKDEGFVSGNHVRVYRESVRDRINVYSKKCIINDQYVVSEIYLD